MRNLIKKMIPNRPYFFEKGAIVERIRDGRKAEVVDDTCLTWLDTGETCLDWDYLENNGKVEPRLTTRYFRLSEEVANKIKSKLK